MAGRLEGKVCVITGAASGIGAESARLFGWEGARVVGVDIAPGSEGDLAIEADVTDAAHVEALYSRVRAELGRVDVLFNNAGINPSELLADPAVERRDLALVGDVGLDRERHVGARRQVDADDAGALGGERASGRGADPARRARDHADLPVEPAHQPPVA